MMNTEEWFASEAENAYLVPTLNGNAWMDALASSSKM